MEEIAIIDVCAKQGKTTLAAAGITGSDFEKANEYQPFSLSFNLAEATALEFRVYFTRRANLWIDQIEVALPPLTKEEKLNYADKI